MFYQKNTWQNGDIITAEKLNNIETGIKNNDDNAKIFIVNLVTYDMQNYTASHTFEQLVQAFNNGYYILARIGNVVTNALPNTSNDGVHSFTFSSMAIVDTFNPPQLAYAVGTIDSEGPRLQTLNFFKLTPISEDNAIA